MKIETHLAERMSIQDFADKHGLVMEVRERIGSEDKRMSFYAHFKHAEIKNGIFLTSKHGNGTTPEEAISQYAIVISDELLVIDALSDNRREIKVPILT